MDRIEFKYMLVVFILLTFLLGLIYIIGVFNLVPQESIDYARLASLTIVLAFTCIIILTVLLVAGGGLGAVHSKVMGFWEQVYFYLIRFLIYPSLLFLLIYLADFSFQMSDIAIAQVFPGFYWKVHAISFLIMLKFLFNSRTPNSKIKIYQSLLNKASKPHFHTKGKKVKRLRD